MDKLLEIIPGTQEERLHNVGKVKDIEEHKIKIEKEFIGKPRICAELCKNIIHIRRKNNLNENLDEFNFRLEKYLTVLVNNYDLRWLISICDTIADHGQPQQKPLAMMIANFVNMIKIADTILDITKDSRVDTNKIHDYKPQPLWDGVITFDIYYGDLIKNTTRRLNNIVINDQIISTIWNKMKERLSKTDNALTNLQKIHKKRDFLK